MIVIYVHGLCIIFPNDSCCAWQRIAKEKALAETAPVESSSDEEEDEDELEEEESEEEPVSIISFDSFHLLKQNIRIDL